jgi:hypothetical protein
VQSLNGLGRSEPVTILYCLIGEFHNLENQVSVFIFPRNRVASYTPAHWVLFTSPLTTCRAMVASWFSLIGLQHGPHMKHNFLLICHVAVALTVQRALFLSCTEQPLPSSNRFYRIINQQLFVCVCVCVRVRACVRVCVRVREHVSYLFVVQHRMNIP